MKIQKKTLIVASLIMIFSLLVPNDVSACTTTTSTPPIAVKKMSSTQWRLTAMEYSLFGNVSLPTTCVCAIAGVGPGGTVEMIQLVNPGNGQTLSTFDFSANATTSASANEQLPAGVLSQGFSATVSSLGLPAGSQVNVQFFVTYSAPTTFETIKADLEAGGFIVTDEGNADGTLALTHLAVVQPGVITLEVATPATTPWLIGMLAALLALFLGYRSRYRQRRV